uniref:Putative microtubule severing n=1 Tax=Ixodes ricinus TaxID=34613 RepID=A0A0K8RC27_IXORI
MALPSPLGGSYRPRWQSLTADARVMQASTSAGSRSPNTAGRGPKEKQCLRASMMHNTMVCSKDDGEVKRWACEISPRLGCVGVHRPSSTLGSQKAMLVQADTSIMYLELNCTQWTGPVWSQLSTAVRRPPTPSAVLHTCTRPSVDPLKTN